MKSGFRAKSQSAAVRFAQKAAIPVLAASGSTLPKARPLRMGMTRDTVRITHQGHSWYRPDRIS